MPRNEQTGLTLPPSVFSVASPLNAGHTTSKVPFPSKRRFSPSLTIRPSDPQRQRQDTFEPSLSLRQQLSPQEQREVERLRQIDRKVRAHEAAHQAAAGSLVRGKSFQYQRGPDGKQYAVSGEVRIDTSVVRGNPAATIRKMQQVQRAALAPADPSPPDRNIAAQARRKEMQARRELLQQRRTEASYSVHRQQSKPSGYRPASPLSPLTPLPPSPPPSSTSPSTSPSPVLLPPPGGITSSTSPIGTIFDAYF